MKDHLSAGQWSRLRTSDLPPEERHPERKESFMNSLAAAIKPEVRAAVINRLLKEKGGHLVVAGGKLDEIVPKRLQNHPQVLLRNPPFRGGELGSNTRALLLHKWLNPVDTRRLMEDAQKIQALVFAGMDGTEIMETLQHLFEETPAVTPVQEADALQKVEEAAAAVAEAAEEPMPPTPLHVPGKSLRKPRLGEIAAFLTVRQADTETDPTEQAQQLLPEVLKLGILQNEASLRQNIVNYRKLVKKGLPRNPTGPTKILVNAIRAAQAGSYSFSVEGGATVPLQRKDRGSVRPQARPERLPEAPTGDLDFDSVEQLFTNAIRSLKEVLPVIEKAREVLPALELVRDELPKVKAEITRLARIREAMK